MFFNSIKGNSLLFAISIVICEVSGRAYSILAIDGGGIRGIIPAVALMNMEEWAYNYMAQDNDTKKYTWSPYINETDGQIIKRVPMKDLFDMMAGTSTGSILSAALTLPKEKNSTVPKFWAT